MGRNFRKKKKNVKQSNYDKPKRERPVTSYEELKRENANFELFYKAQKIVPAEEWTNFISCLREDLPAAFRLTGSKSQSCALLRIMQENFFVPAEEAEKKAASEQSELSEPKEVVKPLKPICLPWYPDGLAWQLNLTRKDIRRVETYWRLHTFLISETETGNISRQEAVSMIPPVLLDVKPHHKVLDMCAAPGSKTAQIIEIMHGRASEMGGTIPPGVVVANDADNKRCYMLTHQAKRMQSPSLVITNHDAAFMPNIMHTREDQTVGAVKFDRILCDVPCSGDGTLRKNFDVWTKWNTVNGANLHGLQLRIARRGLEMLAVGGRMVYSTCSMHPLENEAVMNRLIAEGKGSIVLRDVSNELVGLKTTPGIEDWVIMTREMKVIDSYEKIPTKETNHFHQHQFPPTPDIAKERHLTRCIRVLPHHQNTGAFFVAVLEKTAPLPGEKIYKPIVCDINDQKETSKVSEDPNLSLTQRVRPPPKKRCRGFREEPFYYQSDDHEKGEDWAKVLSFFGTGNSKTGGIRPGLLLSRIQGGTGRNVYFTNALVKDIIDKNQERMKLINAGVKVLVRSDHKGSDCNYRLAQDGIHTLAPLFNKRKLVVSRDDLVKLLLNEDVDEPPQIETMSTEMREQCVEIKNGSAIFIYKEKGRDASGSDDFTITMVGWKGGKSVRSYVARAERLHYLRIIGADTSRYEKNKFEIAAAEEKERENSNAEGKDNGVVVVDRIQGEKTVEGEEFRPNIEKTLGESEKTEILKEGICEMEGVKGGDNGVAELEELHGEVNVKENVRLMKEDSGEMQGVESTNGAEVLGSRESELSEKS